MPPFAVEPARRQTLTPPVSDRRNTDNHDLHPAQNETIRRAEAYAACFEPAEEGNRNSQIFNRACNLVEKFDLTEEQVREIVGEYNGRFTDPLDEGEVEDTVGKAFDRIQKKGNRREWLHEPVLIETYQEPSAVLIDLDDWRKQMTTARIESLNQPGKVFFDGSTTGAGKSTADQAAMRIAGQSVTFLPTHDACNELVNALAAKGFSAAAHPPLDQSTCEKFGTKFDPGPAQLAQKAGLNVGESVCPNCEFCKSCEYQQRREVARNADHTVATHARASTSDFQPAKGKPIIFVHEDAVSLLKPMAKVVQRSKKQDVPTARHLWEVVQIAKAAEEIAVTWSDEKLIAFARHLQTTTAELVVELNGPNLIDAIEKAAELGTTTKGLATVKELLRPHRQDRPAALDYLLHRAMLSCGVFANGIAMKLALAYATGELAGLCMVIDETFAKGGRMAFSKALVGAWSVELPSETVIWFENASANAQLLSEMTGTEIIDKTPQGRLAYEVPPVQYADHDITQQACGKTVRGIIRGLLAKHSSANKVGVITHRCHIEEVEKLAPLWRDRITKLEYFHSGKDRASNAWLECDLILVLGTPRVPPIAVRDMLIRLGRIGAAAKDGQFTRVSWEGKTGGGKLIRHQGLAYAEPSWAKVHGILVKETLRQAIGRGRGVTTNGVPVIVVSNEPLGLILADEPLPLVSDTEDETLQLAVSLTARNAKENIVGKRAVAPFTTGQVSGVSRHETRAVRNHLSSLSSHGLLKKKGDRKGWELDDRLITMLAHESRV